MADTKVSALTAAAAALTTQEIPVNEGGVSKKITVQKLIDLAKTLGVPRPFALAAAHTLASTTGTEVTGLGPVALEAGTYQFQYFLICSSSATATGLLLGLNFTGTAAQRAFDMRYPSTGTTANTGVADDVGAVGGQIHESNPQTAFSTTAPNMQFGGVATANGKFLVVIEGTMVVTASGDLELWHASETAANTSVEAGSTLIVVRCA